MVSSTLHRVRRLRWQARAPTTADAFALRTLLRERGEAVHSAIEQACAAALREAGDGGNGGIGGAGGAGGDHDTVWQVPRLVLRIQAADVQGLHAELPGRVALALRDALSEAGIGPALAPGARPARGAAAAGQARPRQATARNRLDPQDPPATGLAVPAAARRSAAGAHAQASLQHYLRTGGLDWALAGLASDAVQAALQPAALQAVQALLAGRLALDDLLPQPASAIATRIGALQRWLQLLPAAWRLTWLEASPPPAGLKPALQQAWLQGLHHAAPHDSLPWMALWLAWGALGVAGGSPKAATLPAAPALRAWLDAQQASAPLGPSAKSPWLSALRKALGPAALAGPGPMAAAWPSDHVDSRAPRPDEAGTGHPALLVPLAGLVLLHPYLPRFLAGCGVVAPGGRAITHALLPRACALLLALAWGDAEAFEHQLPLVKLLLGLAPDVPLNTPLPRLASADLDEVHALLAAVRTHWAALGGTGIDGLRLSFLQRRGLLRRTDGAWQLHVQAEPFDVLLDLLPWGISLVKLPWMPQPLMVAWP